MESYAINLVLPKLQNGTKWNVNSLQLEVLLFALILGLLRGMLGRSFLLELPPHARRIPCGSIGFLRFLGTTSACAENKLLRIFPPPPGRNYLRVRGEYKPPAEDRAWHPELPPRARRIRGIHIQTLSIGGNYLRVRGEYPPTAPASSQQAELPPRARRIPIWAAGDPSLHGTTSACAENTMWCLACGWVGWNYLRVRGEYSLSLWPSPAKLGTTSACAENTAEDFPG